MSILTLYIPGWGYPSSFWEEACGAKKECTWSWGYWEEPRSYFLPNEKFFIVVHSFGLYMLPEDLLKKAEKIIWYGGFFSSLPLFFKTLESARINLDKVIKKFIKRLFFPYSSKEISQKIDGEKVILDLQSLTNFNYEAFWQTQNFLLEKMVCVFGAKDRIIPSPFIPPHIPLKNSYVLSEEGHLPNSKTGVWAKCLTSLLHGNIK